MGAGEHDGHGPLLIFLSLKNVCIEFVLCIHILFCWKYL